MKFTSQRDYDTILGINKELVNDVIDVTVVLYKPQSELSKSNSYGEATRKVWYNGVVLPCLIDRQDQDTDAQVGTVDFVQTVTFAFLRQECKDRNVYPEPGDVVNWDNRYYQFDSFTETQLFAGQVAYKHSIVLVGHLTRDVALQLEAPRQ